jgi:hypothetical protein
MFEAYTALILALVVTGLLYGAYGRKDTFHPLVYLLPMVGYLYVVVPSLLYQSNILPSNFTGDELSYVQGLNLSCVTALVAGILSGDRGLQRDPSRVSKFVFSLTPHRRRVLRRIATVVGGIGLFLFVYGIINVGGFVAAFDSPKGGGWAPTGYLRDLKLLVIPAIVLDYLSLRGRTWSWTDVGRVALFSLPLLTRGLLATSRGWLFMGVITLVGGWFLAQNRRPSLSVTLTGGTLVGVFMLVLVTYRGEIYIGSSFLQGDRPAVTEMIDEALGRTAQGGIGNEFVYGTHVVLLAEEEDDHYWGARYLAYTVIRPIPSVIWPSKYEDMGVSGIRMNAGTLGEERSAPIYERFPFGMYPGLAGDLFVEFAWGAVLAAFVLGWIYGTAWRRHLVDGGLWTIVYHALFAMSVFAMMQTIAAAFLARILIVSVPAAVLWYQWMPDPTSRRVAAAA